MSLRRGPYPEAEWPDPVLPAPVMGVIAGAPDMPVAACEVAMINAPVRRTTAKPTASASLARRCGVDMARSSVPGCDRSSSRVFFGVTINRAASDSNHSG